MGVTTDNININPEGAKIAKDYTFRASVGLITVFDIDFDRILYVINLESNTTIYNVSDEFLTGMIHLNQLTVNFDTTAMGDNDKLLVVYVSKSIDEEDTVLELILEQSRITNKLLKKMLN